MPPLNLRGIRQVFLCIPEPAGGLSGAMAGNPRQKIYTPLGSKKRWSNCKY